MEKNEITISDLLNGKATIIKNRDYLSTRQYVQPFLDKMSGITSDFRVKVKMPDQMTMHTDVQDITYNRVLIEAVLPEEYCIDSHDEVIGFLYGLDVRKPVSKVYRGYLNRACTNLTVFSNKWMIVNEVKPGELIDVNVQQLMELPNSFESHVKRLKNQIVDNNTLFNRLGEWVDMSLREHYYNGLQNVKVSPNIAVEAYKSLYVNEKSDYFRGGEPASMFDVYNAFTQIITDDQKDLMNNFEKTMMVNKLLKI